SGLSTWFTLYPIRIFVYGVVSIKNGTPFLEKSCSNQLTYHVFGQLILIVGCAILEVCIVKVSFRGSILNTKARQSLVKLLYIRFGKVHLTVPIALLIPVDFPL